jgi:hypothetical protein
VRRFVLVFASAAILPIEASAQEFTSPKDLLSSLYEVVLWGKRPMTDFEPFFSDQLTAAMAGGRLGEKQLQTLGFNPMTGVTNGELITRFEIDTAHASSTRATAIAKFNAGDVPVVITFDLIREQQHGWQINQLSGTSGQYRWDTSDWVEATKTK